MTVYAEKESGEILDQVDNIHWVYGRKISEFTISASYQKTILLVITFTHNMMIVSQSSIDFRR